MAMTISARDIERTNRWLTRSRRFGYVPPEPFALLAARLAARRRALLQCSPFLVLIVGLFIWGIRSSSAELGRPGWAGSWLPWVMAAYGLLIGLYIVMGELTARADRRIGRQLHQRVGRGTALPVWTMLGWVRSAFVVTAVLVEAALSVCVVLLEPGWVASTFVAVFAATCAVVAFGLRRATTRATVAIDPVSLRIDELLRSQDAFATASPLYALVYVFPTSAFNIGMLDAWLPAVIVISGLWFWGAWAHPWPADFGPRSDPLANPCPSPGAAG